MATTDILNEGSVITVSGKQSSKLYNGLLFSNKLPRSSFFQGSFYLLDVEEIADGRVIKYYSIYITNEAECSALRLLGDYYMILNYPCYFGSILPMDDLSG